MTGAEETRRGKRRQRWLLAAVLTLALGLRLAFAGHTAPGSVFAGIDAQGYRILALNLVEHGVLSLRVEAPYVHDGLRTPLYPAFLALLLVATRDAPLAVPLAHALIDTGTAALVYLLGCRLAGRPRGQVAALLYALNPVSFLFIGEAMAEIMLAFLLALTFCVFLRALAAARRRALLVAAAGLLAGLCVLCKPNAFLLPLLLALGWIVERRHKRARGWAEGGALLASALLLLMPWLARNQVIFGRPTLSLAFEDNLAHVSAVSAILEARGEEVAPWTTRWEETYMECVVAPAARRGDWPENELPRDAAESARRSADLLAVARSILRENRSAYLAAHLKGAARSLVPELHRYWYSALAGTPWPESAALSDVLGRALHRAGQGDHREAHQIVLGWWSGLDHGMHAMWLASVSVSVLGFVLLLAGMWALRRSPGILLSIGLLLAVLVLMPGPIGYVRFWAPGVPLGAAVIAGAVRPARQG